MNRIRLVLLASMLSAVATAGDLPASEPVTIDLTKWTPPDIASLGDDSFSTLVKYGHALFTDTPNEIGPEVSDPAKRFAGNNLACESCHLQGGTRPYAMPLAGVWEQFPQYRAREGGIDTLEDRIEGCLERSVNGRPLPVESREMKALTSYMRWLSIGIPDGAKLIGAGTLRIKEPVRAADPVRGLKVYGQICAACHGENGQGKRAQTGAGYQFPPLWGPDSYNDGAGMNRLLTLAAYARHNMPFGTTFNAPVLAEEEAYDVAAYVVSQERPAKANLDRDYPIRLQKPVDAPYGPYADGFSPEQHKYGPYGPIRAKVEQLAARSGTADAGGLDDGSAGAAQ